MDINSEEEFSFSTQLFDDIDLSYLSEEQQAEFTKAKENLVNLKLDFGLSNFQSYSADITNPLSKILPIGMAEMSFKYTSICFYITIYSFSVIVIKKNGLKFPSDHYIKTKNIT